MTKDLLMLSEDKISFIKKYGLQLSADKRWYCDKNQSMARVYFKHQFMINNNMLEIISRKYQLCFAKLKYFRENLSLFTFYKHEPFAGFVEVELWDAEFFRHQKSGIYIDLRHLGQIRQVEVFQALIQSLEACVG